MSIFKVGNFIRHQADENLEFKVLEVKYIEDDDGNDTEEIRYLELVSIHTNEKFEISTDSFDLDVFELMEKPSQRIETNSWNLTKKRIEDCHRRATEWLKDHELKRSLVCPESGVYYFAFRKPESSYYWFDVIAYPTGFTVHGDMGTYTWRNGIKWAKGSIDSIDYFAGKLVVDECKAYEWCSDTATAYVWEEFFRRAQYRIFDSRKDETEEIKELADTRDTLISMVDDGQHSFNHHLYHETNWADGCDFPDNTTFRWSFLACREALMKAFEILDKQGITL